MAYAAAAVFSVMQSMDYLMHFTSMFLRIRKLQIERLTRIARKLASLFEGFSSSADQSGQMLHLAALLVEDTHSTIRELGTVEIEDFIRMCDPLTLCMLRGIVLLEFDISRSPPRTVEMIPKQPGVKDILEEVSKQLEEMNFLEVELDKFYVNMPAMLKEKFPDWMANLDDMFSAFAKLKIDTNFVLKGDEQIKGLFQDLSYLMDFLRDTENLHKNQNVKDLEKRISTIASRAEDFVEEKFLDISLQSKMNSLLLILHNDVFLVQKKFTLLPIIRTALDEIFHEEYGILPTLVSRLQEIEYLKEKVKTLYDETPEIENSQSSSISRKVSKPPLAKEDMVLGLDDISNEILHRRTTNLEILTIVGMAGIGKTTLARRIYDNPFAVYHFHCRAWVTVSQDYQVRDLLLGLLRSVTQITNEIYNMSKEQLAEYLYKRLKGRRYLIVMDDVWSFKAWDDFSRIFPDDTNGSRILLTTRLKNVAVRVSPKTPPYCMRLLGADESWNLMEQKVFGKESCPPELVDCGKHIAKKCQGLPLAIVVISGYLSQLERTYQCWKDTVATLSSLVITDPEECLEILALSYNHSPHRLKACFLYMAAFPEDWEIDVQKLINLWIAEGFLDLNSSKSLEEFGEDCLNDLVDRGLVMVGKRSLVGKIKTCLIHDLLRELCLREARKEKFMEVIKRDSRVFPADLNDKHLLSFHSEFPVDVYLLPALLLVRSFLCFSSGCFFSPDIFFLHLHFKLLRVLDIGFLRFDHFPQQILKLVLLRYLELNVSYMFPAEFSLLCNLQILVIHWNIKRDGGNPYLQLAAPRLRNLHIIRMGNSCIPILPGAFWHFYKFTQFAPKFLETLSTVRFASCTWEVFQILPHIKKLGICETEEDYNARETSNFLANLVHLEELERLKCSFYAEKSIKRYKLLYGAFPSSIKQLTLSWSYLSWEDMYSISWLPNLEVLKLKNYAFQGQEWTATEDGFIQLKHLLIEKTDLERWNASSLNFPRLQSLVLRSCAFLEEIPFSIAEIPTLEIIELHYCSVSAELSAEEIRSHIDGVEVRIERD